MSKKQRQQTRAERTAALIKEQEAKERRRNLITVAVIAVVVVVVGGLVFWALQNRPAAPELGEPRDPNGVTDAFGIEWGDPDAPETLILYEDFQCPGCKNFNDVLGEDLTAAVEAGKANVDFRMVSFLDKASKNEFSSRALNASLAVLDTQDVDAWHEFYTTVYTNQPAEGTEGPEDDELIEWAVEAGADEDEVRPLIEGRVFRDWIEEATDDMSEQGVESTPGAVIDGEVADDATMAVLTWLQTL